MRNRQNLLWLSLVYAGGNNVQVCAQATSYILCPLGVDPVKIGKSPDTEEWKLVFDDDDSIIRDEEDSNSTLHMTMMAKPCWCLTSSKFPAYCPEHFDTCKIDNKMRVSCLKLEGESTDEQQLSSWVVPFLGPISLLFYITIFVSCILSRKGMAAQHYLLRMCCFKCFGRERLLEWSMNRIRYNHADWVRVILLHGVIHERQERLDRGEEDAQLCPTHLVLKTKRYTNDTQEHDSKVAVETMGTHDSTVLSSCLDGQSGEDVPLDETPSDKLVEEDCYSIHQVDKTDSKDNLLDVSTTFSDSASSPSNDTNNDLLTKAEEGLATGVVTQEEVPDDTHSAWSEFDEDDDVCAICMALLQPGDRIGDISCGHEFHVDCLKEWLLKKNECPLCSRPNLAEAKCLRSSSQEADQPEGSS